MPGTINDGAATGKQKEPSSRPVAEDLSRGDLDLGKLSPEECLVFAEILRALKTMRYGSIVLTVHDGHMVELSKTVRLRTKPAK